jgi:hypothetical protein
VLPTLQILRQAPPPKQNLDGIRSSVVHLLGSPHWHLRDMAARTLVALYQPYEYHDAILSFLFLLEDSQNTQHGLLLSLRYMLRKHLDTSSKRASEDLDTLLRSLLEKAPGLAIQNRCPFTKAAFIDIINECGMALLDRALPQDQAALDTWTQLRSCFKTEFQSLSKPTEDEALFQRALLQLSLISDSAREKYDKEHAIEESPTRTLHLSLVDIAEADPDTCCAVLYTMCNIIQKADPSRLTVSKAVLLYNLHRPVLHASDCEVKSLAMSILAESLQDENLRTGFFKVTNYPTVLLLLDELEKQCLEGAPSNAQAALYLLGYFLDYGFHTWDWDWRRRTTLRQIARYIKLLRMTIIDSNVSSPQLIAVE